MCLGAVGLSACCPDVEGLAALHHNAWRHRVATSVHDCVVRVGLGAPHLQVPPRSIGQLKALLGLSEDEAATRFLHISCTAAVFVQPTR